MKNIPLFNVFMSDGVTAAVSKVLRSGYVAQGPAVEAFEFELESFFGASVTTVNAGTSAIHLALRLIGVGPGDEVITTPQTCLATNNSIVLHGASPVFVDVDPESGLIDVEDVARNITSKTKAIVAVDWAGHPCDYRALRSHGIPVVEDAAHAVGTRYKGEHVAVSGGDYVCFSFQAIKHLTSGDGGAIIVPDHQLERARRLRWFGLDRSAKGWDRFGQDVHEAGYKFHMNDISASIGRENLKELPGILYKHRRNASLLHAMLSGLGGIALPPESYQSSWWLFTIKVANPTEFSERMSKLGIESSPVHSRNDVKTVFAKARRMSSKLSGLEDYSAHQISIPIGWWVDEDDLGRIASAVEECAS